MHFHAIKIPRPHVTGLKGSILHVLAEKYFTRLNLLQGSAQLFVLKIFGTTLNI